MLILLAIYKTYLQTNKLTPRICRWLRQIFVVEDLVVLIVALWAQNKSVNEPKRYCLIQAVVGRDSITNHIPFRHGLREAPARTSHVSEDKGLFGRGVCGGNVAQAADRTEVIVLVVEVASTAVESSVNELDGEDGGSVVDDD